MDLSTKTVACFTEIVDLFTENVDLFTEKGGSETANVYCDMNTNGGGWIVIQRNRKDTVIQLALYTVRNWRECENGFGDLSTDVWYGLESIYALTRSGQWEMRVALNKNKI